MSKQEIEVMASQSARLSMGNDIGADVGRGKSMVTLFPRPADQWHSSGFMNQGTSRPTSHQRK